MIRSECLIDFLVSCKFNDWEELASNCLEQLEIEKRVDSANEEARRDRKKRMFPK